MSVTRLHITEREQHLGQISRLIGSHALHGSESLCKLLRYLAEHALDHPGLPLKEYQIATEVFGRPPGFDPQIDSTVRVQAGRLRMKLAEYYAREGMADLIVVELPKGTYLPTFRHRDSILAVRGSSPAAPGAAAGSHFPFSKSAVVVAVALILFAAGLGVGVALPGWKRGQPSRPADPSAPPAAFGVFWSDFTSPSDEPWVIFSNGSFIGRPETGMRYFDPARDPRDQILDHYTGIGEVLAVHALDQVFGMLGHSIRVKRGSLFTLDDAQNNDLIYIGSPAENLTLRDLPGTRDFTFQRLASGSRKGDLAIINQHPEPGEPQQFLATATRPLTEDYAIISLRRGLNPAHSMLVLAGTTTIGTEAAVEYVCRENTLEDLLSRLVVPTGSGPKPFEAVIHVTVTGGVPVQSQIVALRAEFSASNAKLAK